MRGGADGKIRDLILDDLTENSTNPFYRRPWLRLEDRVNLMRRGYEFSHKEVVNRVGWRSALDLSIRAGVAETSLAANTARRLGVTFEELSALVERPGRGPRHQS